jgi:hypothetical protein
MSGEKDLTFNSQSIKTDNERILDNHSGFISKSWVPILEKSINAIVSIKVNCVRSFDTERSG